MADKYSVLVLGLDGATFDLMLPWIDQGHLPCLGGLLARGAWSHLQSTIPPITPCAWSSFMTGKNPGKHGLFDFIEPSPTGRGFRFTNASSRHAETLWGYLSRLGQRVGVVNVPMTYPPEAVNGYQISGLDTPDLKSRFCHPDTLLGELLEQGIDYRLDPRHMGNMRTDARRDQFLQELRDLETIRTRAFQHLRRRYPTDFRMLMYGATDAVQHHFWHYMDSKHDKFDARGAERYRDAVRDVYVFLDRHIASLLEEEGEDTVVMIMSDHGFGPTSNIRLRVNQIFERAGLLAFAREGLGRRTLRGTAARIDRLLRSTLSSNAKRLLASMLPRLRVWFEAADEAPIDWTRTTAYCNEVSRCFPAIWLNHTAAGDRRAAALEAVEKALTQLAHPGTGRPVVSRVYRSCDLYHGPSTDKAPDLYPSWWEDGFLLEQSVPGGPADLAVERSTGPIEGGTEFAGNHRLNGIFIMAGGPVRKGCSFSGARIIDVAPTVLYLMGQPIPDDMDGRPLLEAVDPDFAARNPIRSQGVGAPVPPAPAPANETVFTEAEAELISQRLKDMGYIE
jgi:predicted AlkP superfamily phosphohydrolase/phosphomutase